MQVKNMLKNLFVSGVLVLSSGTACSKEVAAKVPVDCLLQLNKCFFDVLNGAWFDGVDSLCFDITDVQACLDKEADCLAECFLQEKIKLQKTIPDDANVSMF